MRPAAPASGCRSAGFEKPIHRFWLKIREQPADPGLVCTRKWRPDYRLANSARVCCTIGMPNKLSVVRSTGTLAAGLLTKAYRLKAPLDRMKAHSVSVHGIAASLLLRVSGHTRHRL